MKKRIKAINEKAADAANGALKAAEKYVSLFRPDIFGRQMRSASAESDLFDMSEKLKCASETFFECAEACLLLEEELEAEPERNEERKSLHQKAVLLSEINDLCIAPFLKDVYVEALKSTVDTGKIKRSAEVFSVKLKNYMTRII